MKKFKQVISLTITAVLILTVTSGCKSDTSAAAEIVKSPFASFRDIPDITAEEIEAVESFAAQNRTFKYGVLPTTEFFVNENGEFGGYSVLLCEWLSELFGIEFKAGLYQLDDLLDKLEKHEVDFAGSLSSAGSLENTFRTEPIATRKGVMVRIKGSLAISEIEQTRLPRYTFLRGMASQRILSEAFENGSYDDFPVENHLQAYDAIKSGVADAYIAQNVTEEFFSEYGDVYIEDFFPLVFTPVYIIAANPELEPFISVINKSLQNGAEPYLKTLYNQGYDEYKRSKFLKTLSPEEREYLQSPAPVPLAASYYNYPISYYNEYESQWEGITFEILSEIEKHTGLTFEVVNDKKTPLSELLEMLGDGRASMISDLISTVEREERFLLPDYKIITDQCALLSKTTYPNVSVNEINSEKIGLIKDSVHADLFRIWFPKAENTVVYDTADSAVYALDSGEVNLVMSSKSNLLSFLNYYELSDYKANYLFSYNYESSFGFAKDEVLLCSIVDKALAFIDTYMITEQWTTKTYDYHLKMMETQRPWMIGAIVMFSLIIVLILIVLFRSRSEEIRLSRLVKEKTSTLTAILDATPDLIFCQDLNSRTIECNKAFENFFNVVKEEIVGKNDMEAFGWTPEKMDWHLNWNKKVFDEKTTVVIEEELLSPDGKNNTFETIKTPMFQDRKIVGYVGMARDITERKAMERELKDASKAKSQFIANMSHEMRTPMNVVVGLTDLMLEEEDFSNTKENLKKINSAGDTLMALINDVLDISKIEAGKLELMPVDYELPSNVADIITLSKIRLEDKPVKFVLDIDETMPLRLFGDDLRIKQVLNNLLSNSFKYTHKGTVTLRLRYEWFKDYVAAEFTVSDTGIGIKQEDMAKLFTDYNQVDTRANRKIEGTGLGLSITKRIVEMMGGEITVESEYGKGTTFCVKIRQGLVSEKTISTEILESLRSQRYAETKGHKKLIRPDLSYAKVLVVDDFPTNLDVAAGMLRKYKIQVDCVDNGGAAVELISEGFPHYDAVFMDHMMPEMDGVEATALIRAIDSDYARKIPIIALTANAVTGSEQMFMESGFDAYLAKPINVMVLDSIVHRWVRDKSKERRTEV